MIRPCRAVWLGLLPSLLALGCDVGSVVPAPDSGVVQPPIDEEPAATPVGWASVPDHGLSGTTGGFGGEVIDVDLAVHPPDLLENALSGVTPRIVRFSGRYNGELRIGSHKTLIGLPGAAIAGDVHLSGVVNVIVRNVTVIGQNCVGDPECRSGEDAVSVNGGAHHIWFDHMDVSDGSDGNLDITQGSDYVTVSNTKFWYSGTTRNHRFSNLIGSADDSPIDEGKLRVTFHRNHWANYAQQRMPRTRYGLIHVFNNLYAATENDYCINAGFQASLLVENNVFRGVQDPHSVGTGGNLLARGNAYENVEGEPEVTGVAFEPPYEYSLAPTAGLAAAIEAQAGATLPPLDG